MATATLNKTSVPRTVTEEKATGVQLNLRTNEAQWLIDHLKASPYYRPGFKPWAWVVELERALK